jgi:hypothetical protein
MHASSIVSHRMFVAALSPGVSEPEKPKTESREVQREESMGRKTTKAAKRFVELTARPLHELDFGNW